jgi:hypothetical protein
MGGQGREFIINFSFSLHSNAFEKSKIERSQLDKHQYFSGYASRIDRKEAGKGIKRDHQSRDRMTVDLDDVDDHHTTHHSSIASDILCVVV